MIRWYILLNARLQISDAETSKPEVQLYSNWFCPFAQRIWIALLEKGVTFDRKEVNPYDKSPEFLAINPRGLIPVVIHKGKFIYESSVCIEYIDETFSGTKSLLPKDPYERAYARMWNDFITKKIISAVYRLLSLPQKFGETKAEILKNLADLSAAMSDEGPYFMGKDFGMLDIMLVPFTLRFYILKHYTGFDIPDTAEYAKLRKWMAVCHAREAVKATLADSDKLLEYHKRYMENATEDAVAKKTATF